MKPGIVLDSDRLYAALKAIWETGDEPARLLLAGSGIDRFYEALARWMRKNYYWEDPAWTPMPSMIAAERDAELDYWAREYFHMRNKRAHEMVHAIETREPITLFGVPVIPDRAAPSNGAVIVTRKGVDVVLDLDAIVGPSDIADQSTSG